MTTPSREELEKQIRFHEGQSQWNRWSMRVEYLERETDTMAHWASDPDITAVCDGMAGLHAMMVDELGKARAQLSRLSEFAPKPKGRKKG